MYIFDFDGTVTDSNRLWIAVDDEFLARRGLKNTLEYRDLVGGVSFPEAAARTRDYYGIGDSPEAIMAEWEELAERQYREVVPLKEGAKEFLTLCREKGVPTALFTACRPSLCRGALERFGLLPLFDHLVFAEELGVEKHLPQCFEEVARLVGAETKDCVFVDDNPSNCAAAAAAGMDAVGVYDRFHVHRRQELEGVCRRCVTSLMELAGEL